jgi:hypothetical protein
VQPLYYGKCDSVIYDEPLRDVNTECVMLVNASSHTRIALIATAEHREDVMDSYRGDKNCAKGLT